MKEYPTGDVELSIGTIHYAWTEAAHAYISIGDGNYVTIRGVQYHFGLHLFLIDGQWKPRHYNDLYAGRPAHDKHYNKPVSEAARKTIIDQCLAFWTSFVKTHPGLATVAERAKLQSDIDRLEEDMAEIVSKLKDKQALRQAAVDKLAALTLKAS